MQTDAIKLQQQDAMPINQMYRKPLLTPEEFWVGLGKTMGQRSIYGFIGSGKIKHIRVGRKILIPRSELKEFLIREAA